MSPGKYGSSQQYTNWKQFLSHAPIYDAIDEHLQGFYYQLEEYAYGISTILGDMVKDAFLDEVAAKRKYGWDLTRMRAAEEAEEPREPIEEDSPDVSELEDDDDGPQQSTPQSSQPQLSRTRGERKKTLEKPKEWAKWSTEQKTAWEEKAKRRARRSQTRTAKSLHNVSARAYKLREQQYLQRCKLFQLLITTAFSNYKVVAYLRSRKAKRSVRQSRHCQAKIRTNFRCCEISGRKEVQGLDSQKERRC